MASGMRIRLSYCHVEPEGLRLGMRTMLDCYHVRQVLGKAALGCTFPPSFLTRRLLSEHLIVVTLPGNRVLPPPSSLRGCSQST